MDLREVMQGTAPVVTPPDQNLINPTKVADAGRPAGFWKSIILDLLGVLSALAFSYSFFRYLVAGLSPWYPLGFFLAFSTLSALQVFLAKGIVRRTLVILAEAVSLMVCFFFYGDLRFVLVALGVTFVVLLWGYFASRALMHNQLEVRFFPVTGNVLGKVVTAFLFIVLMVWIPQAQGSDLFMRRSDFQTVFGWTTSYVGKFYPGVVLNGSYGDFSKSFAAEQLGQEPAYQSMTVAQQATAVNTAGVQLSDAITKMTGTAPTSTESTSDVVYDYIVGTLVSMKNGLHDQFTIGWIIILFLVLRTLGIIAVLVMQIIALIFYELLLAIGFMRIDEAVQTKEVVAY